MPNTEVISHWPNHPETASSSLYTHHILIMKQLEKQMQKHQMCFLPCSEIKISRSAGLHLKNKCKPLLSIFHICPTTGCHQLCLTKMWSLTNMWSLGFSSWLMLYLDLLKEFVCGRKLKHYETGLQGEHVKNASPSSVMQKHNIWERLFKRVLNVFTPPSPPTLGKQAAKVLRLYQGCCSLMSTFLPFFVSYI